jgi:hypothetical protein
VVDLVRVTIHLDDDVLMVQGGVRQLWVHVVRRVLDVADNIELDAVRGLRLLL